MQTKIVLKLEIENDWQVPWNNSRKKQKISPWESVLWNTAGSRLSVSCFSTYFLSCYGLKLLSQKKINNLNREGSHTVEKSYTILGYILRCPRNCSYVYFLEWRPRRKRRHASQLIDNRLERDCCRNTCCQNVRLGMELQSAYCKYTKVYKDILSITCMHGI